MLETAWESRWLPGLLIKQKCFYIYINHLYKRRSFESLTRLNFQMVESESF